MSFPHSFLCVMYCTLSAAVTVKLHIYRRKSNLIPTFIGTRLRVLVCLNSLGIGLLSNVCNKSIINPSCLKHHLLAVAGLSVTLPWHCLRDVHPSSSPVLILPWKTLPERPFSVTRFGLRWTHQLYFMLNDNTDNSFHSGQRMKRHQRHFRSILL